MRRAFLALALFAFPSFRALAAPPSIEAFAANDLIIDPIVSPDGRNLAYLTSTGRDLALADYHFDTGKGEVLCKVDSHTSAICWKGNDRIFFLESLWNRSYLRSASLGKAALDSTFGYGARRIIWTVADWLTGDPNHILVWTDQLGLLDIRTGEITTTQPQETLKFVGPYIADTTGVLRLRCIQERGGIELQHRLTDHDEFKDAFHWSWADPDVNFLGFGADRNTAYFLTHDLGNWGTIRPFNTTTFQFGAPVAALEGAEITRGIFSSDHQRLVGVQIAGKSGRTDYWIDPAMRRAQAIVDVSLPGKKNVIVSYSQDASVLVVLSGIPGEPGTYYSLDLTRKALVLLGRRHPQVDPAHLGKMTAREIATRDGHTIHAVLTVPPGAGKGPYPLVLWPQGNIFDGRYSVAYDPVVQLLASRGYAVLLLDYRGSWGYGQAFKDAGRHEVTGKIPHDIEDAARWSIQSGYATQGHIALFGEDFGATLALGAATHTPGLYCCVVNVDGDADLAHWGAAFNEDRNWLLRNYLERFIGLDPAALRTASPDEALDQLDGPVLNVYGDDHDIRWNQFEIELRHHGKPYTSFVPLAADNNFPPAETRENFYRQLVAFLGKNLAPAAFAGP
jgi:dienelactone hydrolase